MSLWTDVGDLTQALASTSLGERLPARPGYGTSGRKIQLRTNYFPIKWDLNRDKMIYRHEIEIEPEVKGKKRAQVITLFLQRAKASHVPVSDFVSQLFLVTNLGQKSVKVKYYDEDRGMPGPKDPEYTVTITYKQSIDLGNFAHQLRESSSSSSSSPSSSSALGHSEQVYIQTLNLWISHEIKANRKFITVGPSRRFVKMGDGQDLGGGLCAKRGFFTSLRVVGGQLRLNVNNTTAVFYKEQPLGSFINGLARLPVEEINRYIRKVRVALTYLPAEKSGNGQAIQQIKTVSALAAKDDGSVNDQHRPMVSSDLPGPRDVKFWLEDAPGRGGYITVYDYFKKKYNKETDGYVVNVGTKLKPTYLPSSVGKIMPGQIAKHVLDATQTKEIINFSVRKPEENLKVIESGGTMSYYVYDNQTKIYTHTPLLKELDLKIGQKVIAARGRLLGAPSIEYRNGVRPKGFPASGSWYLQAQGGILKLEKTTTGSHNWGVFYVLARPAGNDEQAKRSKIERELATALNALGIPIQQGKQRTWSTDARNNNQIEAIIKEAAETTQILFVILPNNASVFYNKVKKLADQKYGIRTICALRSKIERVDKAYLGNIALKVNLKLGGNNHSVGKSSLQFIQEGKTMIVGIDVTHPSPGSSAKIPSVAGVVATIDSSLGQWPGILKVQQGREEMVANLKEMMRTRLELWRSMGKHADFPENIIIYRDGVSEGQYKLVLDKELPQILAACAQVSTKHYKPKITLVVAGKRHHTRFYPTDPKDCDMNGNPHPGTLIDKDVTGEGIWDFYLQSHAAIKGTARPAHYVVLQDEVFTAQPNPADSLERMTHALSYMFGRATRSVSYCTPAYYADILCERGRRYLINAVTTPGKTHDEGLAVGELQRLQKAIAVHRKLEDTMFYI
ncbi:Piwi-domain-containing protein [Poronia punctata]|nr:Piwi-domain-containing protein [Poronia punctata]